MPVLLVGFDSAWTLGNSGALVGVLRKDDGSYEDLGPPRVADFAGAQATICAWQATHQPSPTLVLLDQPTIVNNAQGQRPVENLVGAPVSLRYGGVQPANTGRDEMFGPGAPLWGFLTAFGGPANPLDGDLLAPTARTLVIETYPVLALVSLGWLLPDARATGRLPKYNPDRRGTFAAGDWRYVCGQAAAAMAAFRATHIQQWLTAAEGLASPTKADQDQVDACLCLLVALQLAEKLPSLVVGDLATGYMVVPHSQTLESELRTRCAATGRHPAQWVRPF